MSTVMEEESCGDAPFLPLQHAEAFFISFSACRRRRLSSSLCCLSLSIVFFLNHFIFVVIIFNACEYRSVSAVRR